MTDQVGTGPGGDVSEAGFGLVLEWLSQEGADLIEQSIQDHGQDALLIQTLIAIQKVLQEDDLARTRLIVTGDMVASVNAREDRIDRPFTRSRGSGTVIAKTMPPSRDGVVDILVAAEMLVGDASDERRKVILHTASHEAIHAVLFLAGESAFDTHARHEFGDAFTQFVSMASHQVEEHLAECLANQIAPRSEAIAASQVQDAFLAWNQTLSTDLPGLSRADPDFHRLRMLVTLDALHVLWKVFSYLAAELRSGNEFLPLPPEIAALPDWREEAAPWWDHYTGLLGRIPVTTDVDIAATDVVVEEIATLLQRWAQGIGVDHRDTAAGPWFEITRTI